MNSPLPRPPYELPPDWPRGHEPGTIFESLPSDVALVGFGGLVGVLGTLFLAWLL